MRRAHTEPGVEIDQPRIVLVEGEDEKRSFSALIDKQLDGKMQNIQIIPVGGKDAFRKRIGAINIKAKAKAKEMGWPRYVIAVIRDADESSQSAFQSACSAIESAGLEPPGNAGSFTENETSVGVLILPDNESPGDLETVCHRSVAHKPVAQCIDELIDCAARYEPIKRQGKAWAHAYAALSRYPVARVGEAAEQGLWNFTHEAFKPLTDFLKRLASIEIRVSSNGCG